MESNNTSTSSSFLYSLYIPKHYGESSLLPSIIEDFLNLSTYHNKKFDVTISPGYLGEGEQFIRKVSNLFIGHVNSIAIYRGMTSVQRLSNTVNDLIIALNANVDKHETDDDHRKMIFFRINDNTEAILIGSSNFSTATYFNKGKGEADLLLFYENEFRDLCNNVINAGGDGRYGDCVLYQNISNIYHNNPQAYLNRIYDEFNTHNEIMQ